MSLTPTQLQELQTIVVDLGEEFPHNADALWNAAIRIQKAGLGPVTGAGQAAFDAAVADIKVCQEEVQPYQNRQGSPNSGFDVAVLQAIPISTSFPTGNVGDIIYLDVAPNTYLATDQIQITPAGPNSVQMDEVGTTVFRTVPAASGGVEINNLSTGAGFERVLTTADIGGGSILPAGTVEGAGLFWDQNTDLAWEERTNLRYREGVNLGGRGVGNWLSITESGGTRAGIALEVAGSEDIYLYADDTNFTGQLFSQGAFQITFASGINVVSTIRFNYLSNTDNLEFTRDGSSDFLFNIGSNTNPRHLTMNAGNGNRQLRLIGGTTLGIAERASALGDAATIGQFWVRNDAPNVPMFTDDTGVDFVLNAGGAGGASVDTFNYQFSTSTSMTDPGAGFVRLNNVAAASATQMSISATDFDGIDLDPDLGRVFRAYVLTLRDPADPTRFVEYSINSTTTDAGGFWLFPLNYLAGTTLPINNAEISLQLRETAATGSTFVTTGTIPIYNLTTCTFDLPDGDWRLTNDGSTSILHSNDNLQLSSSFTLRCNQPFHQLEQAAAETNIATFGQWWVRDDVPNVPMFTDDAGTDFVLNATGGVPGGANTNVQFNDSGVFGGEAAFVWDEVAKRLIVDHVGGSGISGLDVRGIGSNVAAISVGGVGSASTLWDSFRSYDNGGVNFWHIRDDHTLSSGNHKWEFRHNTLGTEFIQLDASGEMTLGGAQNQGTLQIQGIGGTEFMIALANGNGGLYMEEQSARGAFSAGDGQYWVRDDAPCVAMFTDDAGTDFVLNAGLTQPITLTADIDGDGFNLDDMGVMFMREQAAADADVTGQGQIWVLDEGFTQSLMFTNDNGNDFELAALNLTDMNTANILITGTGFVECLVCQPDINRNYMVTAVFEITSPAADDAQIQMVIDTNATFKGVISWAGGGGNGEAALDSATGEVITNNVTILTDGTASPNGTYVTITGCLRMGATSGTHSVRMAKLADTGADGRFESTAALQLLVLQVS